MVSVNKLASYQLHVLGLTSQFKEEPMLTMGMETYGYVVDQNGFNLSRLSSFLVSFH